MKDQCYEFVKGPDNKVRIAGFGSYGQVKLAKNSETGQIVAIKMIHGRNAKTQIDVHHKLNHPNIIRLLNYYYEKQKNVTYMVLQYADEGTLHSKIKFGYGQLSKDKVKKYFRDVCKAVEYLHSLKYMHRDIKPQNILLTKDGHAKLCDFGFAAILEYRSTLCGTYEYMAPQMIQQKPYDYKVDIWALGILLFELIQGVAPFRGQNGQDVINQMKKPILFNNRFEKQEKDLIKKILRVNAENRPSIASILEHPYLADVPETHSQQKIQKNQNNTNSRTTSSLSSQQTRQMQQPSQINKTGDILKFQSHYDNSTHQQAPQIIKKQKAYERYEKKQKQQKVQKTEKLQKTEKIQKTDKLQKQQKTDKQFKYFVPSGVKANNIGSKPTSSYLSNSSSSGNSQPFYQSFATTTVQPQMTTNNNNVTTPVNQNASIDSTTSYRQQLPIPNFLPNQKMTVNPNSKISYAGQTVPIVSQTKTTNFIPPNYLTHQNIQNTPNIQNQQNIPNYYNHQNPQNLQTAQNVQNFGQWKKN